MADKKFFTYRDRPVAYREIGSGRPLVILHGWGVSGDMMVPLAEGLSTLRSCYVIDLPGFGESPPPAVAWSVDDYADCIETFIHELDSERVDFLVHSFGSRIILKLCARSSAKEIIDKVLITGGAGMRPRRNFLFYVRKYTAKLLKAPFLLLPGRARRRTLDWLRNTPVWKSLGSSDYRELDGVMRETFVRTVTEHLENQMPDIGQEILLLWGRNDDSTPLYQAERLEKGIENAVLVVIDHAGHYAFIDRPRRFLSIAKAFFSEDTTA